MGVLRGGAGVVEGEVVHIGFGEVMRQRPDTEWEGIPAPPDRTQRGDADLDHVAGLRAGHLHRAEHRVRAVRVPVPQRLPVGEAHPELRFVAPVRPGVRVADRVPRLDLRDRLGRWIQIARTDRRRRRLDNVRAGHRYLSPFCSAEPLDEVQRGLGDLGPGAYADGYPSSYAREPVGLVADFYGDHRQGGSVLPSVVRAEQQFQATGQQDPDVSPGAAAVTAVHSGKRPGEGSVRRFALPSAIRVRGPESFLSSHAPPRFLPVHPSRGGRRP